MTDWCADLDNDVRHGPLNNGPATDVQCADVTVTPAVLETLAALCTAHRN